MTFAYDHPVLNFQRPHIDIIKEQLTAKVITIALNITAEGTLALSAIGFHQIDAVFLKDDILLPDFRILLFARSKHLGNHIFKMYAVHDK